MSTALLDEQTDQSTAPGIWDTDPAAAFESTPAPVSHPVPIEVECLCPHCGSFNSGFANLCSNCNLPDNPETRSISGQRQGNWMVLDPLNPDMPEMEFQELQSLAALGLVTARSVVRGPATQQLWRLAFCIRGLSREFGVCYSCGGNIEASEIICPHCDRSQNPNETSSQVAPVAAQPIGSDPIIEQAVPVVEPAQPRVTVHTFSDSSEQEEKEMLLRPVIAEQSERHIPKDDLLTPRDLAKAFQIEFGNQADPGYVGSYRRQSPSSRRKHVFISAGALAMAVLIAWPVMHTIADWINEAPPAAQTEQSPGQVAAATPTAPALNDARPASLHISAPTNIAPASNEFTPIAQTKTADPVIVADASSAGNTDDDPNALWNDGLDAESNGNYTKAIAAYERIESLPSYLWPAHLQVRLELARKELKGEMR